MIDALRKLGGDADPTIAFVEITAAGDIFPVLLEVTQGEVVH